MRVLIIEDDVMWQCKLQIIAEKAGLDVAPLAGSLDQAKEYLRTEIPDLIIADIHLSDGSIFDLFTTNSFKNIPTIFTTASETREDFSRAKKLYNSIILVKPFHHHTLLSTISLLNKNIGKNTYDTATEDNLKISNVEIKRIYKLLGEGSIVELFNLKEQESYILKQRWSELKTFSEIGRDLKLSGQRIQRIYSKLIEKLKIKTLSTVPKYKEYLEYTKCKKNRLEILKGSVEVQKIPIKKIDIKTSIDSLEDLNTKWKNVLWGKDIKTVLS